MEAKSDQPKKLSSSTEFISFADQVRSVASSLPSSTDRDVGPLLERAIAESAQTLRLLDKHGFDLSHRMLEVGSGLGLTSIFLSRVGVDITSVEPAAIGFDWHADAAKALYEALAASHDHLSVTADEVPIAKGPFDLVFSNNVVEHIADPTSTLSHLGALLSPTGRMLHSCPNYAVPYEPHFGIPLVPFRPSTTSHLVPARIAESELWKSLNFVQAGDVRTWAAKNGFRVEFERGQLADSIERLTTDEEFAARHRVMSSAAGVLVATRFTKVLRHLPAGVSTPMEFTVSR